MSNTIVTLNDSEKWQLLAFVGISAWLLYLLSPMLMPFAFATGLAYLGDPLVDRLEVMRLGRWRLNRTLSVLVVFIGIFLVIAGFLIIVIPTVENQVSVFLEKLPSSLVWFNRSIIPTLQKNIGRSIRPVQAEQLVALIRGHWQNGGSVTENLLLQVSHSGAVIIGWLMNLVLIPVITFYLLRDWDRIIVALHNLFPRRYYAVVGKLARESDEVLGAFMRGQFYVMLVLAFIYSAGLWLTGLELAMLIGILAGLLSFIPYVGVITGISLALIAALLQYQDSAQLTPVLLVFAIGHGLESMWLTPWLVGNKIGLHPVAVMFAVLAGGQLFGFLGVLLALPLASVIMVLLRHVHERYTDSHFYSNF